MIIAPNLDNCNLLNHRACFSTLITFEITNFFALLNNHSSKSLVFKKKTKGN